MTTPVADLLVTEPQRERSLAYLQNAYSEGRLTEYELDERIGIVLSARTRAEMNRAFQGLAHVPMGAGASMLWVRDPNQPTLLGRAGGGMAHFSGLATLAVGPGIVYAMAPRGSSAKREAAKAFNFQLLSIVAAMAAGMLLGGWLQGVVMAIGTLVWFLLTLTGGVRALAGEDWRNPVTQAVPLRLLPEGPAPRKALAPAWQGR